MSKNEISPRYTDPLVQKFITAVASNEALGNSPGRYGRENLLRIGNQLLKLSEEQLSIAVEQVKKCKSPDDFDTLWASLEELIKQQ